MIYDVAGEKLKKLMCHDPIIRKTLQSMLEKTAGKATVLPSPGKGMGAFATKDFLCR